MRAEMQSLADEITQTISLLRRHLDWDKANARLSELNDLAEDPNLWNDPQKAQGLMRERQQLEKNISVINGLESDLRDTSDLMELAEMEGDADVTADAEDALRKLHSELGVRQLEALLSGEADGNDTYFEVHSGAGGTESNDWASMLLRMYIRWAEKRGFKVEVQSSSPGDETGIKAATVLVKGENAFGWLKTESGVHRLVRISPFDSAAKRHTSFSSIWVYPVIDDNIEIDIPDSDIRVDTYRSSGAGGQHVNTTDSAVRITHLPTGIVVTSSEKSQHQNRANAMAVLRARLYDMQRQKADDERAADRKSQVGSGDRSERIRTYNFPQGRMTDHRINLTLYALDKIMAGDLSEIIDALTAHDQAARLADAE